VTNTGQFPGSTVPQVYLGAPDQPPAGIQFAVRQLSAFDRVTLGPGQSTTVTMHVPLRQLQYWSSDQQKWLVAAGTRTVYLGDADSPSSLPLQATVDVPASGNVTCSNEQLSAAVVQGNLLVPPGAWCDVVDTSVSGNLIVNGTGVRVVGSTIGGNLVGTTVPAATDPLSSGANVVCNTTVDGNLITTSSGNSALWSLGSCGANTVKGKAS